MWFFLLFGIRKVINQNVSWNFKVIARQSRCQPGQLPTGHVVFSYSLDLYVILISTYVFSLPLVIIAPLSVQ